MINFCVETIADVKKEMEIINATHYDEIALDKDRMKLNPDFDKYQNIENAGSLIIITARKEGKLVGYWILFILPHLHYKDVLCGHTDIYYMLPEVRQGMTGVKLLSEGEKILKKRGVKKIFAGDKKHKNLGIIFDMLKWTAVETQYSKWIGA